MKRFWLLLFLVPIILGTSSSSAIKVKFHTGSLTTAKAQAAREGKLYFVEFMASWCTPCKWMDETTFTDTQLADYIHQNYVAVKVDIDDFDGYAYKQLYNIKLLPSFLIFNSKGELLDQYAESLSAARLLSILKKYNVPANRGLIAESGMELAEVPPESYDLPPPNQVQNVESSALEEPEIPIVSYNITTTPTTSAGAVPPGRPNTSGVSPPEFNPINQYETPADEIPLVESKEETYTEDTESVAKPMAPGTGLYRFSVSRQHHKGYSFQTGVYAAYEAVLLEAAKLEDQYQDYPVIVHIAVLNNKRVYRVMLGEFAQKRDAIQFKRQMERYGVEGVVKGLASL